ncbi:Wzz/FepE/Etk N-terminal domain-containing protein [Amylibacter sp.]|nr:Wzz/FepE/Etk N-terminal domain-containing protein [Amylibacter sp.]
MQNLLNSETNDEIDLRELFLKLWAYKLFIACTCALGILYSGYYALNANKEFSSTAIFKLDQNKSNGVSLANEFGAMAKISGLGANLNSSDSTLDQITGRIFIQNLDAELNFQADPYFNTYNPNSTDPVWKSLIKRAIGWQKHSTNAHEAIWQGIVATYKNKVVLDKTKDGSLTIMVTHANPERAAKIANKIMDKIISNTKNKNDTSQDLQLSYLSNTLAKALGDLEVSQSNLKEFAIEKSALPLESFAAESLKLDALREQFSRTSELHEAVAALLLILQNKTTDPNEYLALRQKFPIVDQVEFRRVLGQNEIVSSWNWPEFNSVRTVFDTLTQRKNMLQSQINASQKNTERSGLTLETFGKLEREAQVAEATYAVLIEQVKAQSMAAGFRPNSSEIYEYASVPISPSSPNLILILAIGAVLGLFVGAALSLVLAHRRGVYYSKNSLKIGAQARLTASLKTLLPLRNKVLEDINAMLMKKSRPILRDMAVEIHKSAATQVVVTSSRSKMTGNGVARALASYMQSESMKVAVIDFSSSAKKLDIDGERLSVGSFVVAESTDHISILNPGGDLVAMELLSQKDFWKKIQTLNSTFDLVFLCADNYDSISLLSALEGQKMFHITIARTKKTKTAILMQMRSLLPIQGLLYD